MKNATLRHDLPPPPLAVRNLVGCGAAHLSLTRELGSLENGKPDHQPTHRPFCNGVQVEQAQFAHLCTVMSNMHHRRAGYPFGTLVDFAVDEAGYPIFCLSPLAIHTRNIMEDPRCSLVVQMPGWTGLANARVTIFGDVYQLPPHLQEAAREIFLQKQVQHQSLLPDLQP